MVYTCIKYILFYVMYIMRQTERERERERENMLGYRVVIEVSYLSWVCLLDVCQFVFWFRPVGIDPFPYPLCIGIL
jgi:hypothetical protein